MVWPVFKTAMEAPSAAPVGSIPTRSRHRRGAMWLVLLAFNHLFAGLEAYVAAHLADFPGDLRFEAVPGGVGASLSFPLPAR